MNQAELKQLLTDKLKDYFIDENVNIDGVASAFCELILKYVDCDFEHLSGALDEFIKGREGGLSEDVLTGRVSIDVSVPKSNIQVKTYYHKELPVLYFFRDGEQSAFLKLKKENKNGNLIMRARFKDGNKEGNEAYEDYTEEYTFYNSGVGYRKDQSKSSGVKDVSRSVDSSEFETEKIEFLQMLRTILLNNGVKFDKELTKNDASILFNEFYDSTKKLTEFPDELKLNEIMRILVEGFYSKETLSEVSRRIEREGRDSSLFYTNAGKVVNPKISMSGEHIMFDVSNERGADIAKYMFLKTVDGFTVFRRYEMPLGEREKDFAAITLNLSNDLIKVTVFGKSKSLVNPIEYSIKFNDGKKLDYSCRENIFIECGEGGLQVRPEQALQSLE